MTNDTSAYKLAKQTDTVAVPENPSHDELKDSLKKAKFSQASHMAEEIFGDDQRQNPKKNSRPEKGLRAVSLSSEKKFKKSSTKGNPLLIQAYL